MTRLLLSRKAGSDKIDKTGSPRVQLLDTTYNLQQHKKHTEQICQTTFLSDSSLASVQGTPCVFMSVLQCEFECQQKQELNILSYQIMLHHWKEKGWLSWQQGRWRHNNVWLHVGKEMPSKLFSSPIPSGTGAESDAAENLGEINARNVVLIQTQSWYIGEKFHKG